MSPERPSAEVVWEHLSVLGYNNYADLWTSGETHFVERLGAAGLDGSAIDVGAHQGSYTRLLVENGFRRIVMVEPHPAHSAVLRELADLSGSVLVEAAVSDRSGSALLNFDADDLRLASLATSIEQLWFVHNRESVSVPTRTLDSIWTELGEERLDLLKIDVEGWEFEALLGASRMLAACPPRFIQIELNQYHLLRGQTLLAFSRLIPDRFACFQLLPGTNGARRVDVLDPLSNVFAFANFVFVDPEHSDLLLA